MTRFAWQFVVLLICLPVAVLATGVRIPFIDRPLATPHPLPVPDGDRELAWLHTTTNFTTWERFVSGVVRAQLLVPGLHVDDSAAFAEQTTAVPEVVLRMNGRPGSLRIRWYKLTSDATAGHWVEALARRDPPPLALVGGGSSDRATDLARALARQSAWRGDRPLLLITTATADEVAGEPADDPGGLKLIDVYDDRTFRFCFTNTQMAEAIVDFVWATPGLRPEVFAATAPLAACSGLAATHPACRPTDRPHVFSVRWQDDPFSIDLHERFKDALSAQLRPGRPPDVQSWGLPYSVGGIVAPNRYEAEAAESILTAFNRLPPQRSLLVLPTITQPARRLLRTLAESAPRLGHRMVAVTGDGIPVNALLRDGEFAWPVHALPVPLVLFTHHNPVGWDEPGQTPPPPPGYELRPPTSTEDVLHFAEMTRVLVEAAYPDPGPDGPVARADDLAARLRGRTPPLFDHQGDRLGGTGEYVVVLWPDVRDGGVGPRTLPRATLAVWRRGGDRKWVPVREVEVNQRKLAAGGAE